MRGQERILREQLARVACETCGADHQPDDMLVLAQRGSRWLVLLTCHQCTRRCIFVASFPHPSSPSVALDPLDTLDPLGSPPPPSSRRPAPPPLSSEQSYSDSLRANSSNSGHAHSDSTVTLDDVQQVRRFLDGFNGDFRTLFGPTDR